VPIFGDKVFEDLRLNEAIWVAHTLMSHYFQEDTRDACAEEKSHENMVRRQLSTCQREKPQEEPNLSIL
jgi:hypothetical protein